MHVHVTITCNDAASACLARLHEVTDELERGQASSWPTVEEWEQRLPRWFLDACAPPLSATEAMVRVDEWTRMPKEAQVRAAATRKWALADWLYWQKPGHAVWRYVSAALVSQRTLVVTLAVDAWPTSLGSFEWLARCAGADRLALEVAD